MDHRTVGTGLCFVLLVGLAAEVGWFAGRARTHERVAAAAPGTVKPAPTVSAPTAPPQPAPRQSQVAVIDKAAVEPKPRRSAAAPPAPRERPLVSKPAISTQTAERQPAPESAPPSSGVQPSQPSPTPAPTQARVLIVISLPSQRAFVFKNGELWDSARVSTGKPGKRTPAGTFTILQKQVHHRSTKYDDAPMPYMQRITWGGVALHAGHVPGYPASHGCIRLPAGFAKRLYRITDFDSTLVIVTKKRARTAEQARAVS